MPDLIYAEPLDEPDGFTRSDVLLRGIVGGMVIAGAIVIGGLPELSLSAPSSQQDADILNFALVVEELQGAFYAQANAKGALGGELATFARVVGSQEIAHAAYVRRALGAAARKAPRFNFKGVTEHPEQFGRTARALEDLGVAAYNGQAPGLTPKGLTAVAPIVSVEARHAAWIRDMLGEVPAPVASDQSVTSAQAAAAVKRTGFVLTMTSSNALPTLAAVDRDGALGTAFAKLQGATRADFLRRCVIGSGALLAATAAPASAAGPSEAQDNSIVQFALTLEYLQAAFYAEVVRNRVLAGALSDQARIVGGHERAHVDALRHVLGAQAAAEPFFNFTGATESPDAFRRTAVAFEDLAVAAYKGQAPRLHSKQYLATLLAIHSVEARHAAWIRRLAGKLPAPTAFDQPLARDATLKLVASTHFIVTTRSRQSPRFTG
jgi:rubrerythrin